MDRRITRDAFPGRIVDERLLRRGDCCSSDVMMDVLGVYDELDEGETLQQNKDAFTAHYIGDTRLFHTFKREDDRKPYRYAGLCEYGESKNLHPHASRRVFVISPFHAETDEEQLFNIRLAKAACRSIIHEGDIPIAPHLYFPAFMADEDWERDFGLEAGRMIMELCDAVVVFVVDGYISKGMRGDIDHATLKLGLDPGYAEFTRNEAILFMGFTGRDRNEGEEH